MLLTLLLSLLFLISLPSDIAASQLLDKARTDYRFQLEEYRSAYQEFVVKREQHQSAGTFATQEELVRSSRKMLMERADVWDSYFQALRIDLMEQKGLEISIRDQLTQELSDEQAFLEEHRVALETVSTREELNFAAAQLNQRFERYDQLSYTVMGALSLARVQAVLDLERLLTKQLMDAVAVQVRDPETRGARTRGLQEVEQTILQVETLLLELEDDHLVLTRGRRFDAAGAFEDLQADLNPAYSQSRRVFELLKELSTGILL